MRRIILFLLLLGIPAFSQTFAGRAGSDIFIPSPARFCMGDELQNACFIYNGSATTKLNGFLDFQLAAKTVATLPSALLNVGRMYRVTDGSTATDCSSGNGNTTVVCFSNGASWASMGGGGGLVDPGSNGVIKRTSLNTTSAAGASDIVSLFSACSGTQYLGADGACHAGGGTPGGSNNSLQFNNSSAFGGVSLTAGQLPVGTAASPAAQDKWTIDVRDYGVKCDNSTNDTTAMNNALAVAVAVGNTTGKTAHIKIPSGYCIGNFVITQGKGLKIEGAGELTTILKSTNANPVLQINGLWYSSFSDMSLQTTVPATNAVLEIDGDYDGVHLQKVQFVSFRDMLIAGGAAGGLSAYAVAVCRQSGGACQGSNLLFENVGLSGASTAVYYQSGFNALGNQFIGGDVQFYTKDGFYILNGTIDVFGTTFETVNGCAQIANGGYDIHTAGGSFPNHILTGIRSEGWTVFDAPGAKIDVFAQNPAWSGYVSNHGTALNTAIKETGTDGLNHLYCATTAGTTGLTPPTWPASGTVADGSVVWTETNYNVVNNATWFDSATSHTDETGKINMFPPIWSATPGNGVGWITGQYTVNVSGQLLNGPFDNLSWKSSQNLLERVINSGGTASLDLYSNNNGSASTSTAASVSPIPAASVGVLTRGGVVKLYLGDNLYEGTDGGTPTTAQYHFTTTANVDGTFARSSGSENYSSFFAQPTINQTGSASGSATILGVYPVLTATKGAPLLMGVGTAASVGGARTNLFTVDPSGNTSVAGSLTFITDNTTDIGAAGATRPRRLYAGTDFVGPIGATTPASGAFTTLAASSTVSGTGFSTYLASPPAIGGTAPAAGTFTTLTADSIASADSTVFGASASYTSAKCETAGAPSTLTATYTTGQNCLPANALIDAVVYRITTGITGTTTSFTIGDGTIAARFCAAQSTLTIGTTGVCFAQTDQTGTSGPRQVSAAPIVVTSNGTITAGAIRLIVFYHTWVPPTS